MLKYLNVLASAVSIILLSCGISQKENVDEVFNQEEEVKRAIFNGYQLKKLNDEGNEFITFLANSEAFNSTYNLQSDHFLLFEIHNSRPLHSGYGHDAVNAFVDLVGKNEREYICKQIESANNFRLDMQQKGKPIPVSYDSLNLVLKESGLINWLEYKRQFNGWLYFIDPPLFSRDGNYALAQHGYMCGSMCGGFVAEIYKKVSTNDWKRVKVISREEM